MKPVRPLDEIGPPEVRAWAACEQLEVISNAAMGFPANHPAMWHAVAMIEESFFECRYVGDQAGPGLLARVVSQYDDVALDPPAYFHPTVGESKSNPDAKHFTLGAHLFAGTWVEANQGRYAEVWITYSALSWMIGLPDRTTSPKRQSTPQSPSKEDAI